MESTAYPFPSVERLAMAMYASTRKIESLPRVTVYEPSETVLIVYTSPMHRAGETL